MIDHANQADPRPTATVHLIYDPFNPPLNAIISVARQLQDYLLAVGGIPDGAPLPFPELFTDAVRD